MEEALVTWQIDIDAELPKEPTTEELKKAALKAALDTQQEFFNEATPWSFTVTLRGRTFRVDLGPNAVGEL